MKVKIVFISIAVLGLIPACNVSDSNETHERINPLDGLWTFQAIVPKPCDDSFSCGNYHDKHYVLIDYSQIHACYERSDTYDGKLIKATKQDVEVVQTKDDFYKKITVNDDSVSSDTLTFVMDIDQYGRLDMYKEFTNEGLGIEGLTYQDVHPRKTEKKEAYEKCRTNATYSTGLIPNEKKPGLN